MFYTVIISFLKYIIKINKLIIINKDRGLFQLFIYTESP